MRANTLVDVLLELNIVNLQDLNREIDRIAVSLYDPRAKSWFKRVVRHWLINIDWLKRPQEAPAVPRSKRVGGRPADYYAEPSLRGDVLWPAWHGEQPENQPNVCPQCKGERRIFDKDTKQMVRCPVCGGWGLGEKPFSGADQRCPDCRGKGSVRPGDTPATWQPAAYGDPGAVKCKKCGGTGLFSACPTCGGSGKVPNAAGKPTRCKACKGTGRAAYQRPAGREGVFMPEALMRFLLGEAYEPGYDPKKRTYTTRLHVQPEIIECPRCAPPLHTPDDAEGFTPDPNCPVCHGTGKTRQRIHKDIESNFMRFMPKKAKSDRLPGEPPTQSELEPYMTAPEAAAKEFHYFDPIQVRRRELFNRLEDVVNFLNYSYTLAKLPLELSPEETEDLTPEEIKRMTITRQQGVKNANALFKQLAAMQPNDSAGFRDILLKSEQFVDDVEHNPAIFGHRKSGKIIARHNNLLLRKCVTVETTVLCANRRAYNNQPASWCLRNTGNVQGYLFDDNEHGPVFFVEKDNRAYIGIHPASGQVKTPQNTPLNRLDEGDRISAEIAPLLVNFPAEIPEESLRREAEHLADILQELRREAGIR